MNVIKTAWHTSTVIDRDDGDRFFATATSPEVADHIVKCVNHHDKLISALEMAAASERVYAATARAYAQAGDNTIANNALANHCEFWASVYDEIVSNAKR